MTAIRQLNPRAALLAAAIAVILVAVAAFAGQSSPVPALAQSNSAAPTNVAARNGANTGDAIVSWTPNAVAVSNRVGWANIREVQAAQAAGNWLEAFNFVEIGGAKNSYTVKRLEPGTQHAFIVATIAANGAYTYSAWVFLTTAGGQHPGFCPITGFALGDGYLETGDTSEWGDYGITLNEATSPATVQFGNNSVEAPAGRKWLVLDLTAWNQKDRSVFFGPGTEYVLDTDTGNGFSWRGRVEFEANTRHSLTLIHDIPVTATTAVLVVQAVTGYVNSEYNQPDLFRIPIPAR